jgi:hypothetical protein
LWTLYPENRSRSSKAILNRFVFEVPGSFNKKLFGHEFDKSIDQALANGENAAAAYLLAWTRGVDRSGDVRLHDLSIGGPLAGSYGMATVASARNGPHVVAVFQVPLRPTHLAYSIGSLDIASGNIVWSATKEFSHPAGRHISLAVSQAAGGSSRCVLVDAVEDLLSYRVGAVDWQKGTIEWEQRCKYDVGDWNSIALDDQGNCLEVHNGSSNRGTHTNLYYRLGKLTGSEIKFGESRRFTSGEVPTVALDNQGLFVEVHAGTVDRNNRHSLFYSKGKVDFSKSPPELKFTSEGVSYGKGDLPAIALGKSGRFVEVHAEEGAAAGLFYRLGTINIEKNEMVFGPSIWYSARSKAPNPTVTMDEAGNWVEVHNQDMASCYYSKRKVVG